MTDQIGDDDYPLEPPPLGSAPAHPAPAPAPLPEGAGATIGYIHSVETGGTVDGPGIRYVAFLQGCPLRCLYCHNPDSWRAHSGKMSTATQLVQDVCRYRRFIKKGGLTLSGGEPLYQHEFVRQVLELCRAEGIHTALDTSGIIPLSRSQAAIDLADLIILDIKALDPGLAKRLTGQSNRNALALLDYCQSNAKPLWIRHVVVPGYTDNLEDLSALASFLAPYTMVKKVELLPFHQMATFKWEALGRSYALKDCPTPTPEFMERANRIFRERGAL